VTHRRDHIISEQAELAYFMDAVRIRGERPDLVRRDRQYAHRDNHYRRASPDRLWKKVVVNYRPVPPQGTWEGEIITAHYIDSPASKEVKLWP
jgi:hypothetical protein